MLNYPVGQLSLTSPAVISSGVLLLVAILIKIFTSNRSRLNLPIATGKIKNGSFEDMLIEAQALYPDEPFILPLTPPHVVLPNSMVDEIKNLPDNELAFMEEIYLRMHGRYTTIGEPHPEAILAIKGELTRGIARTLADLQDEVTYAVDTEIGDAKEWKELYVVAKLLRIVALVSGRIFVGLPLCRNEQWINTTINFTVDLMHAVRDVEAIHPLLRPFRAPFLKTIRQITTYRKLAGSMLAPQFKEILAERAAGQEKAPVLKGEDDSQFNLAQWILNHYKNPGSATAEKLGEEQLSISFAAIHTTTMGGSNALFDLAAHPQYIKPLREEIESVIAEEGYADGRLLKTSMPKLRKLDSFIRESQRINPPAMLTMARLVTAKQGLTLSSGLVLPKGTTICFAHPYMGTVPNPPSSILTSKDSPPLNEFHPFRFSTLRGRPGEENKHQLVTTGHEQLAFGHGLHACPGRFFASNELKVILVELLRRYDLALGPNGETVGDVAKDGTSFSRPLTMKMHTHIVPDPTAKIFFRNRVD